MLLTDSVQMHFDYWVEDLLLSSSSDSNRSFKSGLVPLVNSGNKLCIKQIRVSDSTSFLINLSQNLYQAV